MTFDEARDEMLAIFHQVWGSRAVSYNDVRALEPSTGIWARVTVRHGTGGQSSLGDQTGTRKWRIAGTLYISVFSPVGDGNTQGYNAAEEVADAYRVAKNGCVWYRNHRIREIGDDSAETHTQFTCEFEYDRYK